MQDESSVIGHSSDLKPVEHVISSSKISNHEDICNWHTLIIAYPRGYKVHKSTQSKVLWATLPKYVHTSIMVVQQDHRAMLRNKKTVIINNTFSMQYWVYMSKY